MENFLDQVRNDHHQFDKGKLVDHVGNEPFTLFTAWLKEAKAHPVNEPNAMSVSTVDAEMRPLSRVVYLKELTAEGFVFYTNYASEKGKQLAANPNVHLLFFWPELERQISISGKAQKVPEAMSDAYFESRPRGSKLGAWASHQSERLADRSELETRLSDLSAQFPEAVPRPPHWGGYVVVPEKIEFWQGRPSRLHDRIVFEKNPRGDWEIYRKNP
jgi:pyridoxamine 5'-phosphate oxidase